MNLWLSIVLTTYRKHYERKHGDPVNSESGISYDICWRVRSMEDLCDTISPRPHSIVCTTAAVPASDAHQCLAIHEVRAIVYLMLPRVSRGRFKHAHIYPVSFHFRTYSLMVTTLTIFSSCLFHTRVASMVGLFKPPMMEVGSLYNILNCGAFGMKLRRRWSCLFAITWVKPLV
jgi:hypothetical protein